MRQVRDAGTGVVFFSFASASASACGLVLLRYLGALVQGKFLRLHVYCTNGG
jgi:hypothetical protein